MTEKQLAVGKKIIIALVMIFIIWKIAMLLLQEKDMSLQGTVTGFLQEQMKHTFFLQASYLEQSGGQMKNSPTVFLTEEMLPLYSYAESGEEEVMEDELMADYFRQREGSDEDRKEIEEEELDYGRDALHIENSMMAEIERENRLFAEKSEQMAEAKNPVNANNTSDRALSETLPETMEGFVSAQYPAYTYDWEEEWGYEELVSNFYAVDASTSLKEEYMNLDSLLYADLSVEKETDGPQILIYHTHSQEAFADSVEGDASTTIVGAGDKLARLLTEEYGFWVMHHTGEYDVENRDYAYSNSLPEIERILEENPSIEVVIDLHRDEMKEGKKLVMDLQGRPTARFMFFDGMSYIRDKGDISYLENPYIQENLAFSFQAQVAANEYYPGIARKIYLKAYRYNLHLCPKSMLIELGAQTNTVEEIMNACEPLAHIISIVLNGEL